MKLQNTINSRIFNSSFNELVFYIENDCAEKEFLYGLTNYSWWETMIYKFFPKKFSKSIRNKMGINYINNVINLEGDDYTYIRELYRTIKDLYSWYTREYPFIKTSWREVVSVPKYVDEFGNDSNSLFSNGKLNKLHDDYISHISKLSELEETHQKLLESKLKELIKISYAL